MKHVPMWCDITGCHEEATYWIDTSEGFGERLLAKAYKCASEENTFYLCLEHASVLMHEDTGMYAHLRIDTGEIVQFELGSYSCSKDCVECNR